MARRALVVLLGLLLLGAAACGSSSTPSASSAPSPTVKPIELWPLPDDPMALARKAGLEPERAEQLTYHVHAHLDVFKDGRHVLVPGGIGIDIKNPGVKRFDEGAYPNYGGIEGCEQPCISPLHTHGADGVLHTESATKKANTFGQFLIEWNVKLPSGTKVYVDGKRFTGDIGKIELTDRKEIAMVMGTPPSVIPSTISGA